MYIHRFIVAILFSVFILGTAFAAETKKVVFIAGPDSHGFGSHAHSAGLKLLASRIDADVPGLTTVVVSGGWPKDKTVFDGAAAVVAFGDGNLLASHAAEIREFVAKGIGFGVIHYALDVPKESGNALLTAIGGYYEQHWSVNPSYRAEFKEFPNHPVARGLKPFSIGDEWYYHMRFVEPNETSKLIEILHCVPPDSTRNGKDGAHSGNPTVRKNKGRAECVCWVFERNVKEPNGRGFGFTGAHNHWNWGHPMFLKTVLNAIVWTAGADVPENGVPSAVPTFEELLQNHPKESNLKPEQAERIQKMLDDWKKEFN